MAGERVLLIDADLRRSSLHRVFNVDAGPGLNEVLGQTISAAEAIVPTACPNLFLLPAGEADDPGSEIFLTRTLGQLLQELSSRFTYILVDTAPVLATDDAGTLGSRMHGALVVVRAAYTSAGTIREALERLRTRRVKLLGLVYNRAAPSTDSYSQYGREYYMKATAGAGTRERPKHRRET
jgi:tyrosine-protein kinase Etk/Wzc